MRWLIYYGELLFVRRLIYYGVAYEMMIVLMLYSSSQFVGESILWVLNKGLGEEFTPEVRTAWETAYGFIADTMQEGAKNQDQ